MNCIVCKKKIQEDEEICQECDKILDMIMDKRSRSKDAALNAFREYARKEGDHGLEE